MNGPPKHAPLTSMETRALVNVAADLADDFGIECAIVVVDGDGVPRAVERAQAIPGPVLEEAMQTAQIALTGGRSGREDGGRAAGLLIQDAAGIRGALGIAGGPEGFAPEACQVAARAPGFGVGERARPSEDIGA